MFYYICCLNSVSKLEFDKEIYQAFPIERDGKARNSKITTELQILPESQQIVKKNGNLLPIYL